MAFFGLDRIGKVFRIIKANGGIRASLYKIYRTDDLRVGTLVGTDAFGNKYYEDNSYFQGRNRWVEYSPSVGTDYDGSQIPAEWFGWMHHKSDIPPTKGLHSTHAWQMKYVANMSGTEDAYMPYSTTKPKIEAWIPPKKQ
ncbi:putative NADH dehydrogenase [ubiquinone] 1 alpha subcomplex subunit 12 [Oratosquilla oratoria]|uniref:putative NADH dehydrogenase [ubiquinone] 1 alpha subcomplex subunit 12 n=1 Tax=Oratosquilla oratoria TaxID=337810 RepID=UPI003F7728F8